MLGSHSIHGPSGNEASFTAIPRQWALLLFAGALTVRFVNLATVYLDGSAHLVEDSSIYLDLAEGLAATGQFGTLADDGTVFADTERTPLYPYFLAFLSAPFGSPWLSLVIQSVLDSATVVLIAMLGCYVSLRVGLIAGALAMISGIMTVVSAQVLTDSLFLFFFAAACVFFANWTVNPSMRIAIGLGIMLGLATLTRPVSLPFIPVAALGLAIGAWVRQTDIRQAVVSIAIVIAISTALLAPQALYQQRITGSFQLSDQGPNHLSNFVVPLILAQEYGIGFDEAASVNVDDFEADMRDRGIDLSGLTSAEIWAHRRTHAIDVLFEIGLLPVARAWATGIVINTVAPGVIQDVRLRRQIESGFANQSGSFTEKVAGFITGMPIVALTVLSVALAGSAILVLIGLLGIVSGFRAAPVFTVVGLLMAAYFLGLTGPVLGPKYRLPAEPFISIFQSIGIVTVWSWYRKRS